MDLKYFIKLYRLWDPVYPYLSRHIGSLYGRTDGNVLEIGPFCGTIFELCRAGTGTSFSVATFPGGMEKVFHQEAGIQGCEKEVAVIATDSALTGITDNAFDLIVFRGALFFPEIFQADFKAIYRVLKMNGLAIVGGGFGKFTPQAVIDKIGEQSKELNLRLGKAEVDEKKLLMNIESSGIKDSIEIVPEGGLWVIVRKGKAVP